jgi:hypothetical protein
MNTTDLYELLKDKTELLAKYSILRLYVNTYRAIASHPGAQTPILALQNIISDIAKAPPTELLVLLEGDLDIPLASEPPPVPEAIANYLSQPVVYPKDPGSVTPPGAATQLQSLIEAAKNYAASGFKNCTNDQYQERLAICNSCEFYDRNAFMGAGRCLKCGCSGIKLKLGSSTCPIGKWGAVV